MRPSPRLRTELDDSSCGRQRVARAAECLDARIPLEDLSRRAAELTRENFPVSGSDAWRMLLYAPLYLSSHCINRCLYCGFRAPRKIERKHLSIDEAAAEAEILERRGLRHLLLVAGDWPALTTTEYFSEIVQELTRRGIDVAVEIAPQTTESYARLAAAGACGVTLYQETYDESLYAEYHPGGSKGSYDWRLEGLQRAAEAGLGRLGLGILLGLADPRDDLLALVRHGDYLRRHFPAHKLAFSLPRIHDAPEDFETPHAVDDETFVRLYCALRVAFPDAELVLSTRESESLRGRLAKTCITQMSAGSCTVPGGYDSGETRTGNEQFPVDDRRAPDEISRWLKAAGFTVAWRVDSAE